MFTRPIAGQTAALIALSLICGCSSFTTSGEKSSMVSKAFIPTGNFHDGAVSGNDLRKIYQEYGFRKFFICGPGVACRLVGYPELDAYEKIANQINTLRKELSDTPVKFGWWCGPSLKLGFKSSHQHIVGSDGKVSPLSICPLDEKFRRELCERFALVAGKAAPEVILIEDDYSLQNHSNTKFGCFCPLHLAKFAEKEGKNYSREELHKIFSEDKRETLELRRRYAECARESLVSLAAELRSAVDKVAPQVRIGLCETLNTDADGFAAIEIARALAGKNTKPFLRVRCAWYTCSDSPQKMPDYLAHTLFTAERLPGDFEFFIEADTYPHTTYFASPEFIKANIANAYSMGADNCLLYALQYLDDPAEESGFLEMYKLSSGFFREISRFGNTGTLDGVKVVYDPQAHAAKKLSRDGRTTIVHTSSALARMGIPVSTVKGKPAILVGQNADVLSDAEIKALLSDAVLLDAEAAEILEKRGFGDLIGVSVKPVEKYGFVGEKICDIPMFENIRGRFVYNLAFAPAGTENAVQYKNPVPRKGAEILSYFFDPQMQFMQPGMVRFTNKLGGKVCVLASTISFNLTANLFNMRKQEMLRQVINWLRGSDLPAVVSGTPNTWLRIRKAADADYFIITNLSTAVRKNIPLHLAPEYKNITVSELQNDGSWKKSAFEISADGTAVIPGEFSAVQVRVFKITKD